MVGLCGMVTRCWASHQARGSALLTCEGLGSSSTALPGQGLADSLVGGLRLNRANDQLGVGRTRDEIERHAVALDRHDAVLVTP